MARHTRGVGANGSEQDTSTIYYREGLWVRVRWGPQSLRLLMGLSGIWWWISSLPRRSPRKSRCKAPGCCRLQTQGLWRCQNPELPSSSYTAGFAQQRQRKRESLATSCLWELETDPEIFSSFSTKDGFPLGPLNGIKSLLIAGTSGLWYGFSQRPGWGT